MGIAGRSMRQSLTAGTPCARSRTVKDHKGARSGPPFPSGIIDVLPPPGMTARRESLARYRDGRDDTAKVVEDWWTVDGRGVASVVPVLSSRTSSRQRGRAGTRGGSSSDGAASGALVPALRRDAASAGMTNQGIRGAWRVLSETVFHPSSDPLRGASLPAWGNGKWGGPSRNELCLGFHETGRSQACGGTEEEGRQAQPQAKTWNWA